MGADIFDRKGIKDEVEMLDVRCCKGKKRSLFIAEVASCEWQLTKRDEALVSCHSKWK